MGNLFQPKQPATFQPLSQSERDILAVKIMEEKDSLVDESVKQLIKEIKQTRQYIYILWLLMLVLFVGLCMMLIILWE